MTGARGGPNARGGARLKRSRTEAGMSPVDGDAAGADKARSMKLGGKNRSPCPPTRIVMLPVMASTGDFTYMTLKL